ncbi:MAG: hypothetical protein QXG44_04990, partial [Candidatus Jordarchaeaceae archaeon]
YFFGFAGGCAGMLPKTWNKRRERSATKILFKSVLFLYRRTLADNVDRYTFYSIPLNPHFASAGQFRYWCSSKYLAIFAFSSI